MMRLGKLMRAAPCRWTRPAPCCIRLCGAGRALWAPSTQWTGPGTLGAVLGATGSCDIRMRTCGGVLGRPLDSHRSPRGRLECHATPWRPHVDDVDRLARGEGAKRRGTGSFHVPHRLNTEERSKFAAAKSAGYLAVRGTGYRRERKGHPLPNSWRQWCDAKAQPCVVVELDTSGSSADVVVVDLSTLRASDAQVEAARERLLALAQRVGISPLPPGARPADAVPFNIIPDASTNGARKQRQQHQQRVQMAVAARGAVQAASVHPGYLPSLPPASSAGVAQRGPTAQGAGAAAHSDAASSAGVLQEAQEQADAAAREVRRLKEEEGWPNSAPVVKDAVARMKQLRERVEQLQRQASGAGMSGRAARLFSEFGDAPAQPDDAEHVPPHLEEEGTVVEQAAAEDVEALEEPEEDDDDPVYTTAIWGIPAQPLFLSAQRTEAKAFAALVVQEVLALS